MKKNIFNLIIIMAFSILFLEILFNKTLVFDTISMSLDIWVNNLIPAMFPFFVISDILISYQIINYIPKFIKKSFSKIFNVSEQVVSISFLSFFSGFPSNARNTRSIYDKGLITADEASHALTFTHFANPLFVLSTVGVLFLNCEGYGYIILFSHYLGNVIIGFLFRNKDAIVNVNYNPIIEKSQSFGKTLTMAIKSSIDTLFLVLGTLTCFLIVSTLIVNRLNLDIYSVAIIKGILEMTMGLRAISLINICDIYKVVISCMFISFGGFSVHLQVLSQLVDTNISYYPFLVARIFHSLISGIICCGIYILIY